MQKIIKTVRCLSTVMVFGFIAVGCQINQPAPSPRPPAEPSRPSTPPPTPQPPPVSVDRSRTSLGPVVAPTSGGAGFYQDKQEQYLRARLEGSNLRLLRNGDVIKIIVPGVGFAFNGEQLQPRVAQVLDNIAPVLKEFVKTTIDIKGYTDSTGSFEHNQYLSEQRAQSVGAYLGARQISLSRIRTAGFGPRAPIADNRSDAGRAQNRRVEIELVPAL